MCHKRVVMLAVAASQIALGSAAAAESGEPQDQQTSDIIVTGAKVKEVKLNESASATGLDLTLRETPQSVTVIDRQRIQDFALTNITDVLDQAVGVNVNRNETDRTDYTARGFSITNRQVDGIGLALQTAIQFGDVDTVLYERVDIVRGANAIMTGVGNPSATINYLRKRPTDQFQANASAYSGSFDMWRVEGDVSGPLNASGTIRARMIGAHEERDSWLDYDHTSRDVGAALLAVDLSPDLTATVGYSRQDNRASGNLWGALPLVFSDDTPIPYKRSASTSAPWTHWNNLDQQAFGELAWKLGGDWTVRGVFTYRDLKSDAKILYVSGGDTSPDPATGLGAVAYSGLYPTTYKQHLIDGYASGSVELFGRRHQLALGVSSGWASDVEYEGDPTEGLPAYDDIRRLGSIHVPEPTFTALTKTASVHDHLTRVYGSAHLYFTDRLKGVAGVAALWLDTHGLSYGSDQARNNSAVSPYAGLLFDLTRDLTLYGSYTSIYNPQTEVDVNSRRLDPAKGTNIEAGIKGAWLNDRLYATAAVFRARQSNLATASGTFDGDNGSGPVGSTFFTGNRVTARGIEVEVSGRVTDRWLLAGGVTHLNLRDADGPARLFVPRDTVKLTATYQVPEWRDLKLGANLRYQSETRGSDDTSGLPIRQGSYATLDLLAGIRVIDHVEASLNLRNVTNKKYLNSLEFGQGFYAAPRSAIATLRFVY